MEKFSKWRDNATGIHPFIVASTVNSTPKTPLELFSHICKSYIIGPPLSLIKLLLISALFLVIIVGELISELLVCNRMFRKNWRRFFGLVIMRLNLMLLGFWSLSTSWVASKKGRIKNKMAGSPGDHIGDGDIVICNLSSYVDVLYFYYRFNPVFTIISTKTPGKLQITPFWRFLWKIISFDNSDTVKSSSKFYSLQQLRNICKENHLGPIIVFPEGTTSNGKSILQFLPVFNSFSDINAIHLVGIKYPFTHFSPTFTVGKFHLHLFNLLCQWNNEISVKYLIPGEFMYDDVGDPVEVQLAETLATILRTKRVALDFNDKTEFLKFYALKHANA